MYVAEWYCSVVTYVFAVDVEERTVKSSVLLQSIQSFLSSIRSLETASIDYLTKIRHRLR